MINRACTCFVFNPLINFFLLLLVIPQILHFDFGEDTVNSGDMATTNCAVTKGDFPIKITWLFNGKPIESVHGVTTSHVNKRISTLSIESVAAEHAGVYTCRARNKAGSAEYSATLNVKGIYM